MSAPPGETQPQSLHDHLLTFYDDDQFLVDSTVAFLSAALEIGEPAIAVATAEHLAAIEGALRARLPHHRLGDGHFVGVDADETLDRFMVRGGPDPDAFEATLTDLLGRVSGTGGRARIFGEMVAVLWDAGNVTAALALEDLWNDCSRARPFLLSCAYPIAPFQSEGGTAGFWTVCGKHTHVVPSESYSRLRRADTRLRPAAPGWQPPPGRSEAPQGESELEAALRRLEKLDRVRNEFVAMVVHDIRGPVGVMSASLRRLLEGWSEIDDDKARRFLESAGDTTRSIQRLLDDILTMAQIEAGEFTYELGSVDLHRVVSRAADEVHASTGHTIEFDDAGASSPVLADEDRQVQILTNLLSNAVRFSNHGRPVVVTVRDRKAHVEVSVHNHGKAIAPDDQARIFRPFARLGDSHGGAVDGTGLGLCISRALVEGQGGRIWVHSDPGSGTTFAYTVPPVPTELDAS